jgi:hypothetical protein
MKVLYWDWVGSGVHCISLEETPATLVVISKVVTIYKKETPFRVIESQTVLKA